MNKNIVVIILACLFASVHVEAQRQRVDITTDIRLQHSSSIVKIMQYDPALEQKFKMQKGTGILSTGSGVIVDQSGIIFTNRHTIEKSVKGYIVADVYNSTKTRTTRKRLVYQKGLEKSENFKRVHYIGHPLVFVQAFSQKKMGLKLYIAEVLSFSSTFDGGAIIKIVKDINGNRVNEKFNPVRIGNSDKLQLKDDIIIAGYSTPSSTQINASIKAPLNISAGTIEKMNYTYKKNFHYFETGTAINRTKDGGPVFNTENKLVGIIVAPPGSSRRYIAGVNTIQYLTRVDDHLHNVFVPKGLTTPKKIGALSFETGKRKTVPKLTQFAANTRHLNNAKVVTGTLKNVDSGSPVANGVVGLFIYDPKSKRMLPQALGRSDANGRFKLNKPVPFKEYHLLVKANGYKPIKAKKTISKIEYQFNIGLEKVR